MFDISVFDSIHVTFIIASTCKYSIKYMTASGLGTLYTGNLIFTRVPGGKPYLHYYYYKLISYIEASKWVLGGGVFKDMSRFRWGREVVGPSRLMGVVVPVRGDATEHVPVPRFCMWGQGQSCCLKARMTMPHWKTKSITLSIDFTSYGNVRNKYLLFKLLNLCLLISIAQADWHNYHLIKEKGETRKAMSLT